MWIIDQILEADFGCEEREDGTPLSVLVYLSCEDGRTCQLEVADEWLAAKNLNEGDEWPFDLDEEDESIVKQNNFMDRYLNALEELEDE